ncbi:CUE domain-containing protein 2 [Neocloeon triangulifer]|uniref:CUE domain-containing protein 2 n=1 Tax=Neocloeon triangulifer TaxID=2078957 RepID=UPI00286F549B|nr:CUE domain-containing protein 2 [Neocloeon triangulifer]
MSSFAEHEDLIKEALFKFLRSYIPSAQLSSIDEIVLSYVVSILEELGMDFDGSEDTFDVDGFCEMMTAYFPEFSVIGPAAVCTWIFELAASLSNQKKSNSLREFSMPVEVPLLPIVSSSASDSRGSSQSSDIGCDKEHTGKRVHHLSETSEGSSDSGDYLPSQEEQAYIDAQLELLLEMFPTVCNLEVRHCLAIAGGDVEQAAQLVLHRQDAGESLTASSVQIASGKTKPKVDDQELKERIIARYSYIDQAESSREHRPVAPKSEPKKMVRYRDNKIVSLKGERFSEVKKDDEEVSKKTYVNLKPAKQYRFH